MWDKSPIIVINKSKEMNAAGSASITKKRTVPAAGGCSNHRETIANIETVRAIETAISKEKKTG